MNESISISSFKKEIDILKNRRNVLDLSIDRVLSEALITGIHIGKKLNSMEDKDELKILNDYVTMIDRDEIDSKIDILNKYLNENINDFEGMIHEC